MLKTCFSSFTDKSIFGDAKKTIIIKNSRKILYNLILNDIFYAMTKQTITQKYLFKSFCKLLFK